MEARFHDSHTVARRAIGPALDPESTTVEVWLKLPNSDGHLEVATPVHAVILGTTVNNALQVLAAAIIPAQDGGTAVMLVGVDGAALSAW